MTVWSENVVHRYLRSCTPVWWRECFRPAGDDGADLNVQAVIAAVARDKLYFVPPGPIQRHTPRLLDGADRMCQRLETVRGRRVGR